MTTTNFFGDELPTDDNPQDDTAEVLDLSGVDENVAFQAVPSGTYGAVLADAKYTTSSKNNPMIEWIFELDETTGEYRGRKQWYHTVLTGDNGLARLKKLLVRMAPDLDLTRFCPNEVKASEGQTSPTDLIGRKCRLKLTVRMYEGERRNQTKEVLAPLTGPDYFEG